MASNIDLQISYSAPPSYRVITAVSTLVNEVIELGYTEKQAAEMVNEFLHLPEGRSYPNLNPLLPFLKHLKNPKPSLMRSLNSQIYLTRAQGSFPVLPEIRLIV